VASQGRPTIRDVAARAGVSISTVSHVFSGRRTISTQTADRVRDAAVAIGYEPHPGARSLRTGSHGILGLILRPSDAILGSLAGSETFTRYSGAVAAATLATGRGLIHVPDLMDTRSVRVSMDGCIVMGPYENDPIFAELARRSIPAVSADTDPANPHDPWAIRIDWEGAVDLVLDSIRDTGARRIVYIGGTEKNAWNLSAQCAYQRWCNRNGVSYRCSQLYEGEGAAGAETLARSMLDGGADQRPDAFVVGPTRFAVGVARAAQRQRLSIPGDLQIASLTDSDLARLHEPQLSGLDLKTEELGAASVQLLLRRIAGFPAPDQQQVHTPVPRFRSSTRVDRSLRGI
jgi:DNA-binding LacI/PurR family transcriptional regulator